jgi:hypothetical protein
MPAPVAWPPPEGPAASAADEMPIAANSYAVAVSTYPISVPQRGYLSGFRFQRGRKKVGEQLVDALVLVVVHPMRGVGQPFDAVEVRYVVVLGLS